MTVEDVPGLSMCGKPLSKWFLEQGDTVSEDKVKSRDPVTSSTPAIPEEPLD